MKKASKGRAETRALRGQVLGCSHDLAGCRQRHLVGQAGNAKVGHLDPLVRGNNQVAGFDVPVNQPLAVGSRQGPGSLSHDIEDAIGS